METESVDSTAGLYSKRMRAFSKVEWESFKQETLMFDLVGLQAHSHFYQRNWGGDVNHSSKDPSFALFLHKLIYNDVA